MIAVAEPLTDRERHLRARRVFMAVDANRSGWDGEQSAIGVDPVEERAYFGPGIEKLLAAIPDDEVRRRIILVCFGVEDTPGGRLKWRRVRPTPN